MSACRIPTATKSADMSALLHTLVKKIKVPLMIDIDRRQGHRGVAQTLAGQIDHQFDQPRGRRRALRAGGADSRGAIGAALVVGCIDEDKQQAQAVTRERKLQIAQRSFKLLTEKYGIEPEDIIFDPLVFPVGTGDKNYIGSGVETIEGIRLIKAALPRCKTILGISNVSFGLPEAGREVLNSVMLYHCVQAGLDLAIVNSEKLERYPSIPEEERRLAEDLIWWRGDDPIAAFAAYFRERKSKPTRRAAQARCRSTNASRSTSSRVRKDGLTDDLDEALEDRAARSKSSTAR